MINEKIKTGVYKTVDQFINGARLMFNNCRQYNEEGSAIVKDANTLEKRLYAKTKEMGIAVTPAGKLYTLEQPGMFFLLSIY